MEQPKTAVKWQKVYVFISSTFNDMHAERDYLVKKVFPELQEWCERRKLRLVDIDLRWGVTEQDATHNRNAVKVCLERIDDCRPFFLCFLGQRRGWVPQRDEISAETYLRFPELANYAGTVSITELEILHALIKPLHNGVKYDERKPDEKYEKVEHAFFYLRDNSYLKYIPALPPLRRSTYTNEGIEDAAERARHDTELTRWRATLARGARPCHAYTAEWDEQAATPEIMLPLAAPSSDPGNIERWRSQWAMAGIAVHGLSMEDDPVLEERAGEFNRLLIRGRLGGFKSGGDELKDAILADLKPAIATRFPEHREKLEGGELQKEPDQKELQKELDQQEEFLYINSEGFIEREGAFGELDEYLTDPSRRLFVLTAPGGMGKSMLLANWIDRRRELPEDTYSLHFRFVGQSDRSTTLSNLLRSLMLELQLAGKIPKTTNETVKDPTGTEITREIDFEIPRDPIKIENLWKEQLTSIGTKGKSVIVIDAVNQLDTGLKDLVWLPLYGLPENIKLIVSFRYDATGAPELLQRFEANPEYIRLSRVKPFEDKQDRVNLVNAFLSHYLKEIDVQHLKEIIDLPGAENPLYLKVVLSELRVFGSFGGLAGKIGSDFGTSPVEAFDGALRRLERDPAYSAIQPKDTVPLLFGLMAHARHGLAAEELAMMFLQALGLDETKEQKAAALETAHLFLRQVRPFLARRDGRFDFFYESFKAAALGRYVRESENQEDTAPGKRSAREWHRILAGYFGGLPLWENREAFKPTIRKVAELSYHQAMGEMWEEVEKTLCDPLFVEAKCAAGQVFELQGDYRLALDRLPENQERSRQEHEREARTERWTADMITYAQAWSTRRDQGTRGEPVSRSEPELPLPIPSCRRWTDEEIQAECQRIIDHPTRLDRLVAFAGFVTSQCYPLLDHGTRPEFVLQHAFNYAPAGPVQDAVRGLLREVAVPLLLRRWQPGTSIDPKPALLRTLEGAFDVHSVSVTPDGKRAVSGGWDNTVRVWDLESGKCLSTMEGHSRPVRSVSVTPDGRRAVSGSEDNMLQGVWDLVKSGKSLSGSRDNTLRVWDLETRKCLRTLEGHTESVTGVSVTPDGRRAVSAESWDNTLRVWDVETGKCLNTLKGHSRPVRSVSVTPDGRRAVSGSEDNMLRVWDVETGKCLSTLKGHIDPVLSVSVTADGRRAVSGSWDNTLRVWDVETGKCLNTLEGHSNSVLSVSMTPDGRRAVSGSSDNTLRVWDLESGNCLSTLKGHTESLYSVSVMPDGRRAVSGSSDNTLRVWDLESGNCLSTWEGHSSPVTSVSVMPDGRRGVSGSEDKTLRVWDLESGECLRTLEGHTDYVYSVSVMPDGRRAVSGSGDALRVWDLESGESLRTLEGHTNSVYSVQSVSVTPDGRRAVSAGSWDKTLRVWDLETGKCLNTLEGHTESVTSVSVTPDGRRAVSGSEDKTLRVWDLESGNCLSTMEGHSKWVYSVSVTPDGRRAVSGSKDKTLRVWDLEDGKCLGVFVSAAPVRAVMIHSALVLAGTESGEVLSLELKNLIPDRALITAVRLWLFDHQSWNANLTAFCPLCGSRFNADPFFDIARPGFVRQLLGARKTYVLKSPEINCPLPGCNKPLKLNPFVCDNSGARG